MSFDKVIDSPDVPISEWLYVNTGLAWASQHEVEAKYRDTPFDGRGQIACWLVRQGQVTVRAGGGTAVARDGEWIFPGTGTGRQLFRAGTVILSIRFSAEWPTGKALFDHERPLVLKAGAERKLTRSAEALERLVRKVSGRGSSFRFKQSKVGVRDYFILRRAFEDWLAAYVNTMLKAGVQPSVTTVADPRVLKAARFIDNHSLRTPLRESELALKAGLSVSQLNRLFLRDLGISPKSHLERRRLQEATLLLQYHRRSVKETAYELGFSSLPHFSAWFRRKQGVGPRAYLKREGE